MYYSSTLVHYCNCTSVDLELDLGPFLCRPKMVDSAKLMRLRSLDSANYPDSGRACCAKTQVFVTGPRIDVDCDVLHIDTTQSSSIHGAYDCILTRTREKGVGVL